MSGKGSVVVESSAYDVAVVGGGLAGLTAGLRAAQIGRHVIVLEQGEETLYPCSSRYAGGWFHLAFHDPTADPDWLVATLLELAPDDLNHPLIESIARNAKRALGWLVENGGARFIRGGPLPWHKNLLAPPRPPRAGLVWPGCGPDLLVRQLGAALVETRGTLARGHRVVRIARDGQCFVIGCATATGETEVTASALVLADGGFAANVPQLNARVSAQAAKLLQRNAGTAHGTSIALALALGAKLTETRSFYGHLHSPDALANPRLWPYPTVDYLALVGIIVNKAGRRFIDDGRDGIYVTNQLAGAADPRDAFVIFDTAMWEDEARQVRVPCNPLLQQAGGSLFIAPTLFELAAKAGIEASALVQTVSNYNEAARHGQTHRLPIPKSPPKAGYREIVHPPYFAIPICPGVTHTMGGVTITPFGAVQDETGATVPGLFAAGSAVGGAEGGRDSFYLGGLCKAATLGLLCGEGAAQFVESVINPMKTKEAGS